MTLPPWEEIDHTADWALRVRGRDLRELMQNAAVGMMSLLGENTPSDVTLQREINVKASDAEMLLVNWLTELLYLIEDEGIVFSEIVVQSADSLTLTAEIFGGPPSEEIRKHIK